MQSNGKAKVSAFDFKIEESPNPNPPLPEKLQMFYDPKQALLNTVDWRVSESLRHNIDAYQGGQANVKVEDLISKVQLENTCVSPSWPFISSKKRHSLVLESSLRPGQQTLERAFEEFQLQQSINLANEDELLMGKPDTLSDQERIIQLLKDRRKQGFTLFNSDVSQ